MASTCKKCGATLNEGKFCSECGAPIGSDKKKGKKVAMGCSISFCFIVFLFLALIIAVVVSSDSESSKGESNAVKSTISVSAGKILEDFSANEISAKEKYDDQTISVTGIVESINVDELGFTYIVIYDGDDDWSIIQCYIKSTEKEKAGELKKGEQITIAGEYDSYSLSTIHMHNCVISE